MCGEGRGVKVGLRVGVFVGNSWRKGAFCSVCIFHNSKMHVHLI